MAVDLDEKLNPESMAVPAINVNRFQIVAAGPLMRIAFAEAIGGEFTTFRSAVVLTLADAKELADTVNGVLAKHAEQPLVNRAG